MKFAKELEEDLVPEWRVKYLNYKGGKKKVKAISRALRSVNQTPRIGGQRRRNQSSPENGDPSSPPPMTRYTSYPLSHHPRTERGVADTTSVELATAGENQTLFMTSPPTIVSERQALRASRPAHSDQAGSYGSITGAPARSTRSPNPPALTLPDPALDPTSVPPSTNKIRKRRYSVPTWKIEKKRIPYLRRAFPTPEFQSPADGVPAEAYAELDARQRAFFTFLDNELAKIEGFYKLKEAEATDRLEILREQLHTMRDRTFADINRKRREKERKGLSSSDSKEEEEEGGSPHASGWKKPIQTAIAGRGHVKRAKTLESMVTPPGPLPLDRERLEARQDFVRRAESQTVPYRTAKRKLKLALKEFYRGLELLKAYVYLNRKAFRKMNKKYDRATNSRPTGRYLSEKVNNAWFVQSDVVENHIVAVEDLYARYFERGNRKIAVGKLRSKSTRSDDYSPNTFRNGLLLAAGLVFGIQGLVHAVQHLYGPDPTIQSQTSFLLQIYGGFFLILFHFLTFCLDCKIWSKARINYAFVFEFDTRHVLDWRQLAELPCLFIFLLGLVIWLNFSLVDNEMFLYWTPLVIGLTVLIVFFPARVFYHRTRRWWAYSNWRLLLAGLYPVEFRDFFLGDMYCSQTYATGNIALFFCLYTNGWEQPTQCNSHHSRLLGFFGSIPPILRAFQCLRRYRDTKNVFPHLANFCKYFMSILYCMTLSLYRIDGTDQLRAIFITCACLNSIFCSVWDLAMDWSLCNPYAKHPFLRNVLGFRRVWIYYLAMLLDPILRFNWIFYAIYSSDIQHSALLSFLVAFSEICRRGMWSIFRVENEHCTNVHRFRASRDIPLPYTIAITTPTGTDTAASLYDQAYDPTSQQDPIFGSSYGDAADTGAGVRATATGTDLDLERVATADTIRRRRPSHPPSPMVRGMSRVGAIMATAHAQDFERKKSSNALGGDMKDIDGGRSRGGEDSTDYEDEDDEVEDDEVDHDDDDAFDDHEEEEEEEEGHGNDDDDDEPKTSTN